MSALMSSMQLWIFPTLALVLFMVAFAAILLRVFQPSRSRELDHASRMPISDDAPVAPDSLFEQETTP